MDPRMDASLVASSMRTAVLRAFEVRSALNCGRLEMSGAGGGGAGAGAGGEAEKAKGGLAKDGWLSVRTLAIAVVFGGMAGFGRALLSCLPPDFFDRWKKLIHDQPLQEPKVVEQDAQAATVIYDCHGVVLARIVQGGNYSSQKADNVAQSTRVGDGALLHPSDIPSTLWQAVVASEDRRFFQHQGIDARGLTRAVLSLASSGGGSTITQQVWACNSTPIPFLVSFVSTTVVSFDMVTVGSSECSW